MFLRLNEIKRTRALFLLPANSSNFISLEEIPEEIIKIPRNNLLSSFIYQSGLTIRNTQLIASCIISALASIFLFQVIFSIYFAPIFFALGFLAPLSYIELQIKKRASNFNSDYPQFLLAMSSSIKVGLTPYQAMEKAIKLLSKESLLKSEVEILLKKVSSGKDKDKSIEEFAQNIRLPDVKLFRSALSLVIENGGRFAPTLARLATVSNNRTSLIRSAEVSTANMRMTANILLSISPIILIIISINYDNYWETLINNSTANNLATLGSMIILSCYLVLRKMSNFKP